MINALHTLIYADDPDAVRAFFRDVLRMPFADTGGGWLIFKSGPSEIGMHPNSWERREESGVESGGTSQAFDVSLMCDNLTDTVAELAGRGAKFDGGVVEQRWGHTIALRIPGAGTMTLFEPTYDAPATRE